MPRRRDPVCCGSNLFGCDWHLSERPEQCSEFLAHFRPACFFSMLTDHTSGPLPAAAGNGHWCPDDRRRSHRNLQRRHRSQERRLPFGALPGTVSDCDSCDHRGEKYDLVECPVGHGGGCPVVFRPGTPGPLVQVAPGPTGLRLGAGPTRPFVRPGTHEAGGTRLATRRRTASSMCSFRSSWAGSSVPSRMACSNSPCSRTCTPRSS